MLKKIVVSKRILPFLGLVFVCLSVLGGLVFYKILNEKPPQFFPLNNPIGEYKIAKGCPNGQGSGSPLIGQEKLFCIEYKGSGVWSSKEANFFSVTVGNSQIDLEPLDGKKVKNIKGEFVSSSKQCIQNKCVDLKIPLVVLNLNSLDIVE